MKYHSETSWVTIRKKQLLMWHKDSGMEGWDAKVLYWVVNFEDAAGVVGYEDTIILRFRYSNVSLCIIYGAYMLI